MGNFSIWHWLVLLIFGGIGWAIYLSARPKTTRPTYSSTVAPVDHGGSNDQTPTNDQLYERVADELRQNSLRQGLWARAFAESDGDKGKAQAAYIRYRVAELQQITSTSQESSLQATAAFAAAPSVAVDQIRPWVRYWARMFDICVFSLPAGLLLGIVAPHFVAQKGSENLLGIVILFLWVFVEALLLSSFGTTPGKWLFKTKLALASGEPITYSQAIARSLKVWWRGLGIGFPIASLITLIIAYGRLKRNAVTSWDRDGNFVVTHEKIGVPRVLAAIGFFIIFIVIVAVGNSINA